jgi:prevent-host-death family protein
MNSTWQVQEAKNRFSEVIARALTDGPQTVTRHGRPVVRVVSVAQAPTAEKADGNFASFLLQAPRVDGLVAPVRRSRKAPLKLGA